MPTRFTTVTTSTSCGSSSSTSRWTWYTALEDTWYWIVGTKIVPVVAIIAIIAAVVVALSGCDEPAPVAAYRKFEKAIKDGDLETAWSLLSSRRQEDLTHEKFLKVFGLPSMQEAMKNMPPADIVECEVEGDRAVITAEGTGFNEGKTSKTSLVLENNEWKLESSPGP